jgi:hypothetical protein
MSRYIPLNSNDFNSLARPEADKKKSAEFFQRINSSELFYLSNRCPYESFHQFLQKRALAAFSFRHYRTQAGTTPLNRNALQSSLKALAALPSSCCGQSVSTKSPSLSNSKQ